MPKKARGQNFAGETYAASREDTNRRIKKKFNNSIILTEIDFFFLVGLDTPLFFFAIEM